MKKLNKILIAVGLLFIAAAIGLVAYNLYEDARAGSYSASVLEALDVKRVEQNETENNATTNEIPDYKLTPEMEMPVETVESFSYVGVLEIPSLGLSLPIMDQLTYSGLRLAPCRYSGTAYQNNLVIGAHNYYRHFGRISSLSVGDEIYFTDMDGNVFQYVVMDFETLEPTDIEYLKDSEWALSLFTCNYSGSARFTIRCELKAEW